MVAGGYPSGRQSIAVCGRWLIVTGDFPTSQVGLEMSLDTRPKSWHLRKHPRRASLGALPRSRGLAPSHLLDDHVASPRHASSKDRAIERRRQPACDPPPRRQRGATATAAMSAAIAQAASVRQPTSALRLSRTTATVVTTGGHDRWLLAPWQIATAPEVRAPGLSYQDLRGPDADQHGTPQHCHH